MITKPFCFNKSQIKVFVLGADPTNFSDKGKPAELFYAFGIGQNPNYFRLILANLNQIGFHLEDVYIQNLCTQHLDAETSDIKDWANRVKKYIPGLKKEFDKIDKSRRLPVFLTAEVLYKALLNNGIIPKTAKDIYKSDEIVIPAEKNKLGRPLIPFFRHPAYNYENQVNYFRKLSEYLSN
jgi:hypothetical protein